MKKEKIDVLKIELSKIGTVQICKASDVFTLMITGENLDAYKNVNRIQNLVLDVVGEVYPLIECIKNDEHFFTLVLKGRRLNSAIDFKITNLVVEQNYQPT